MNQLSIDGGRVWTGIQWTRASVGVRDGKVATLTARPLPAARTVDARGLLVLPGLIDSHVHFGLGVGTSMTTDGFAGGSRAAAFGGVTTVIDFLDPVRTAPALEQAWNQRAAAARASCVDYGFHATLARPDDTADAFVKAAQALGCPSLKVFTTYSNTDRRTSDRAIGELLAAGARAGTTVLVHAENESLMDLSPGTPVALHEESRPAACEVSEVLTLAELVRQTQGRLYVVHTNVGTTVERLKLVHPDLLGKLLFLETCPHYLVWDKAKYRQPDGARFTMTPPLRSAAERKLMAANFDQFHVLGTDHCAYDASQKDKPTTDNLPMGIGGVEFLLTSLWGQFGEACLPKLTAQPARIHGLWPQKGNLLPGADADVVLFDPKFRGTVTGHHGDADHTAWQGHPIAGRVVSTLLRGHFVVENGHFQGAQGQFVKRRV
jgi:dihydropyrimidinase